MDAHNSQGLVGLLARKMGYLNQRSSVLSENVANANTPGYKAKDLSAFTFGETLSQFNGMNVTNSRHIVPASMAGVNARTIKTKSFETLPTGNSVELEQQMMQVSETSVNYQLMTSLYHKVTGWFRIAVKSN
jgi:flagellar basal-body rod protein FlgB